MSAPLVDRFGRVHRDLRVSLTDRCNLRCTYCMPAEGVPWIPSGDLLTTDELVEVVDAATGAGIEEVRLTGGEPLLRPDVADVVGRLAALPRAPRLSLTTNGLRLATLAGRLADAGLERVNVSLDTLRRDRFLAITRRDRLADVVGGIAAAKAVGLEPIKLNAVLVRGVNDDEVLDLCDFAIRGGHELRFIEEMPLGAGRTWSRDAFVPASEILARIADAYALEPIGDRGSSPAQLYSVAGGLGVVGVIASISEPFCGACDRVRLTADGQLRACLFAHDEHDVRAIVRSGAPRADRAEAIAAALRSAVGAKLAGHGVDDPAFIRPRRPMSAIGG